MHFLKKKSTERRMCSVDTVSKSELRNAVLSSFSDELHNRSTYLELFSLVNYTTAVQTDNFFLQIE